MNNIFKLTKEERKELLLLKNKLLDMKDMLDKAKEEAEALFSNKKDLVIFKE